MAVAFGSSANVTPGTGASFSRTLTVAGVNAVLLFTIGLRTTAVTVSSIAWTLGGSLSLIKSATNTNNYTSLWALAAPTAGAGTLNVTLSGSADYNGTAACFTGAHQVTPCPVADAVSSTSNADPLTLTAANLTANDASFGGGYNNAGNWVALTPTQLLIDNASAEGALTGYAIGTSGITFDNDGTITAVDIALAIARIAAAATSVPDVSMGKSIWMTA